jgi:hypothetical protein
MATVREGNKAVLLVVDVQLGVMSESWARAHSVPVIWVQHSDKDLAYASPQWQ